MNAICILFISKLKLREKNVNNMLSKKNKTRHNNIIMINVYFLFFFTIQLTIYSK